MQVHCYTVLFLTIHILITIIRTAVIMILITIVVIIILTIIRDLVDYHSYIANLNSSSGVVQRLPRPGALPPAALVCASGRVLA